MFDLQSAHAEEFIHHETILATLEKAKRQSKDKQAVSDILEKAATYAGLNHEEAATLLFLEDPEAIDALFQLAKRIKLHIYGRRIVLFAPLYLSDYCVNDCRYCGYKHSNPGCRRRLTQEEIRSEVEALQRMGHKRLALELGEDPVNAPLSYVLESIETIYGVRVGNGSIRRVNVNIAATTVDAYRQLKAAGIGTYILFQETYHKPSYAYYHPTGPKANYAWHTEAMDRAMEAGIDDVGIAPLFGLYDPKYELVATLLHAEHLEARMGVGPHTISLPRVKPAEGLETLDAHMQPCDDALFKKIVAVLRCAVPYTGMILSTRESEEIRTQVLELGISQVSAGSCTGVGGYTLDTKQPPQFEISDHRSPDEIVGALCRAGYIPSFCTACYRQGRTGDRFMALAKSGHIGNVCQPNALLTLQEYMQDYASPETRAVGEALIREELAEIGADSVRERTAAWLERIRAGERDFRL